MLIVKPTPFGEALDKANQVLIGSPMTAAEWSDVPVALREQLE
jgi:hypothetical protein